MCIGCYQEYESPVAFTTNTYEAVQLIGEVYAGSGSGGNCHIVIDDWNLEDGHIDWVLALQDLTDTERRCMEVMKEMSEDERATALAIHDRFIQSEKVA